MNNCGAHPFTDSNILSRLKVLKAFLKLSCLTIQPFVVKLQSAYSIGGCVEDDLKLVEEESGYKER